MRSGGRKNPLMSLWLSGANKVFGAARGHAMNEARREQSIALRKTQKAVLDFWSATLKPGAGRRKRKGK